MSLIFCQDNSECCEDCLMCNEMCVWSKLPLVLSQWWAKETKPHYAEIAKHQRTFATVVINHGL